MFYANMFLWGFSAGPANIVPYITLISSLLLISVTSGLSFFHLKTASVIAVFCLVGLSFLEINLLSDLRWALNFGNLLLLCTLFLYIYNLVNSIVFIMNYKKTIEVSNSSRLLKIIVAFLPVVLILLWLMAVFFRF
jgi:hypothetical protein